MTGESTLEMIKDIDLDKVKRTTMLFAKRPRTEFSKHCS